nr:vacuolar ATPase assembly integral membrane protein VMA21 isoform X3 [Gorilla gorilla gorilla]
MLGSPCRPQLSDRDADEDQCSCEFRGRRSRRPPRRTMLRGKSRLNVEWLGYSPGLLLEYKPLLAGRTPRSRRRDKNLNETPLPREGLKLITKCLLQEAGSLLELFMKNNSMSVFL